MSSTDIVFISKLEMIVRERLKNPRADSYTAQLAAKGTKRLAQKVGEEAVELALAAASGDREETIDEAADLVYHLIVLLADQDLSLADISQRLELRHLSHESKS